MGVRFSQQSMSEHSLQQKLIAEFVGTFFLALTICTAAVHGSAGEYAPFAIAATLMVRYTELDTYPERTSIPL